jgi:MoxR-like ATPase
MGAKALALARGRSHATRQDVEDVAEPVLRHRLILDFRAQAEGRDFAFVFRHLMHAAYERTLPKVSSWTRPLLKPKVKIRTGMEQGARP